LSNILSDCNKVKQKEKIIHLDLQKVTLYGWLVYLDRERFEEYCRCIINQSGYPPLHIEKIPGYGYQLPDITRQFSQHYCAYAHFHLNIPVPCIVFRNVDEPGDDWEQLFNPEPVQNIKLRKCPCG